MNVYHGSTIEIQHPKISYAQKNLDFGKGFYLTPAQRPAENWALSKSQHLETLPVVNIYNLDIKLNNFRKKEFSKYTLEWAEFVYDCIQGGKEYKQYDIIFGGAISNKIYTIIDKYYRGVWKTDRMLDELHLYNYNEQICLLSQKLINKNLKFIESYEVR